MAKKKRTLEEWYSILLPYAKEAGGLGNMNYSKVADALGVDRSTVSKIVKKIIERGWDRIPQDFEGIEDRSEKYPGGPSEPRFCICPRVEKRFRELAKKNGKDPDEFLKGIEMILNEKPSDRLYMGLEEAIRNLYMKYEFIKIKGSSRREDVTWQWIPYIIMNAVDPFLKELNNIQYMKGRFIDTWNPLTPELKYELIKMLGKEFYDFKDKHLVEIMGTYARPYGYMIFNTSDKSDISSMITVISSRGFLVLDRKSRDFIRCLEDLLREKGKRVMDKEELEALMKKNVSEECALKNVLRLAEKEGYLTIPEKDFLPEAIKEVKREGYLTIPERDFLPEAIEEVKREGYVIFKKEQYEDMAKYLRENGYYAEKEWSVEEVKKDLESMGYEIYKRKDVDKLTDEERKKMDEERKKIFLETKGYSVSKPGWWWMV